MFLEDYLNDPLNMTDNITTRMGEQIMTAMAALQQHPAVTDKESVLGKLPLLIMQGTQDKVTSVTIVRQFFKQLAGRDNKELKELDGLYHCLFNEPEKQQVLDYITHWLLQSSITTATANSAIISRL